MINSSQYSIAITGALGFIGSCLVSELNNQGIHDLILVDDFSAIKKEANLCGKKYNKKIEREDFFEWLETTDHLLSCIVHLGAKTNTREFDYNIHKYFNEEYSKKIWKYCCKKNIRLIYASSAATYGDEKNSFSDEHSIISKLKPLNPYAISKNNFDKWTIDQFETPPFWVGLKFFNVYGPNEYHKNGMASMVFHTFNQIKKNGQVQLFKSYKPEFYDGEQIRDFIYVKDIIKVIHWLIETRRDLSGIYNLGTGVGRTFNDLVNIVFRTLSYETSIEYIDMPIDLRKNYQYYTQADMTKFYSIGFEPSFYSLEEGIRDYVGNYLTNSYYY
ncbi:MAG: ADP-glyceromanno-heptose 6-epimerase [Sphingobacterium sp.]|jgi:ADP-L-glycero-D-manno-heptose 6-epimerase|nr:ADP-glyceromanno-heptose 6-epimerase [Sphingobacterium sp.]